MRFNLSPLKVALTPTSAGAWDTAPDDLSEIASRLDVPDGGQIQETKSVPDAWAQARSFADALVGARHPQQRSAVAQWRALIALFALAAQHRSRYRLDLKAVPLSRGGSRLDDVLLALPPSLRLPQERARTEAEWSTPWLITIEAASETGGFEAPRAIGLLSPASLVAPGRMLWRAPAASVPWMAGGLWIDPLTLTGDAALTGAERKILHRFLLHLKSGVDGLSDKQDDPVHKSMARRLDAFIEDCKGWEACEEEVIPGAASVDAGLPDLYQPLRTSLVIDPGTVLSECLVRLRSDLRNPPFEGVILADPAIAARRGKSPREIIVWKSRSLAEVTESANAFEDVRREAAEHGYLLVRPHLFFSKNFLRLGLEANVRAHPAGPFRGSLIPVSPLALLIMDPASLTQAVRLGAEARGGQTVMLRLRLESAGVGRTGVEHDVSMTYETTPQPGQGRLIEKTDWSYGSQSVWPDIVSPQWNWYFARLNYITDNANARGRFATSGEALSHLLANEPKVRAAEMEALCSTDESDRQPGPFEGDSHDGGGLKRRRFRDGTSFVDEIECSRHPFEAIFFGYGEPRQQSMSSAGLALLPVRNLPDATREGVVAVDFGTTNTVVCFTPGTPLAFGQRLVHPMEPGDQARKTIELHAKRWGFMDFMPPDERRTPTPTVVLGRTSETDPALNDVLLSSLIYFQPSLELSGVSDDRKNFNGVLRRARFNLKWDKKPVTREASNIFLRQLMMMTCVEALEQGLHPDLLTWRFSRPDSMEKKDFKTTLETQLELVRPELETERRRLLGDEYRPAISDLYSEGRAASAYVMGGGVTGNRFVPGLTNIILDIGGGTTDIAIFAGDIDSDGRPHATWRGSYRLAGQDFFTRHLIQNPSLLRAIGLDAWATVLAPEDSAPIAGLDTAHVGELLFSGPELEQAFDRHWLLKSETEDIQGLLRTSEVFLGGLAWYLGAVCKGLVEMELLDRSRLSRPAFALCGRGAGLFVRLHRATDAAGGSSVTQLLELFQVAVDGPPIAPDVFISPVPKMEVVNGMHGSGAEPGTWGDIGTYEPSGLAIPWGGEAMAIDADIVADRPPSGSPGIPDLSEFQRFLTALAERTGYIIDILPDARQGAATHIQNAVSDAVARSNPLVEPPFITALRELLVLMTEPGRRGWVNVAPRPAITTVTRLSRRAKG